MTLTILDPCTGHRVTVEVATKLQARRARRQVLRELDRISANNKKPSA